MTTLTSIERSFAPFAPPGFQFFAVQSENLRGRGDILVYTPEALRTPQDFSTPVPVAILLHGACGSGWAWAFQGGVHQTLERLITREGLQPMVLIMPSDGLRGATTIRNGEPVQGFSTGYCATTFWNTERWIVEDVLGLMRAELPLFTDRSPVFMGGLSMGGYAALRLGAKYASQFRGISAHSSVCLGDRMRVVCALEPGDLTEPLEEYDPLFWLQKNRAVLPPFRMDCGAEDHLFQENTALHEALNAHEIPHEFAIFPGAHTWKYWGKNVAESLHFFAANC